MLQLEDIVSFDRQSTCFLCLKVVLTLLIICKSIQVYQSRPTKFYYSNTNKLIGQFLEQSKIKSMTFRPHLLLNWHFA